MKTRQTSPTEPFDKAVERPTILKLEQQIDRVQSTIDAVEAEIDAPSRHVIQPPRPSDPTIRRGGDELGKRALADWQQDLVTRLKALETQRQSELDHGNNRSLLDRNPDRDNDRNR